MKVNMLTEAGKLYMNEAIANSTDIELVEIAIGDGIVMTELESSALTELKSNKMTYGISSITETGGVNSINAEITNLGLLNGFRIRELGIYAKKTDGTKVLFWYINYDDESSWLQSIGEGLIRSPLTVKLVINVDNLTITNVCDLDIVATKNYVDSELDTKLTVLPTGQIDRRIFFGEEDYNAIHPRGKEIFTEGAFLTINKPGANVIGIGSSTELNEIRIGLARTLDGSWIDSETPEAKGTIVKLDGTMSANKLRSREGEVSLGSTDNVKLKYNPTSDCVEFEFASDPSKANKIDNHVPNNWNGILKANTLAITNLTNMQSNDITRYTLVVGGVIQTPNVDFTVNMSTGTVTLLGTSTTIDLNFFLSFK